MTASRSNLPSVNPQSRALTSGQSATNHDGPYQPRIIVFACNWCSYTAADLAGTTRLQMPPCFTVLRVMCSGRVDPLFVLQAFALGADGVLISGCHPGDCHYTSGNLYARQRIDFLQQVLKFLGLGKRLEMQYISAAEGKRYQEVLTAFAERIARLGPSSLRASSLQLGPDKRDVFRTLFQNLVKELRIDLPETAVVPPELIPEGYGQPQYDPERCIGCGACAANCPQHNIELTDVGQYRTISHFESRCVGCATCEQVCPVDAIQVVPRFDLTAFLADERHGAIELELACCARCGQPIAPNRQLEFSQNRLEDNAKPDDQVALCAACRRSEHAATMRQYMVAQL